MAFPTTSVIDSFTNTNGTRLPTHNANWTEVEGTLDIQSNQCRGASDYSNTAFWEVSFGANSECYVTVTNKGVTGDWIGIYARMTTLSASTMDGYSCFYDIASGNDTLAVQEILNGAYTNNGASVNDEIANNDVLGLEIIGSTIKVYQNGVEKISRSDSTYGSAGYIGFQIGNSSASHTIRFDQFGGGTISSATVKSIAETGHGTDALSQLLAALLVSQAAHGSETTPIRNLIPITDNASSSDILANILARISVNESGSILELVNHLYSLLSITDNASASDNKAIAVNLSLTDSVVGSDNSIIRVLFSISDSASGSEIITLVQHLIKAINDIGQSSDSLNIRSLISVSDVNSILESILINTSTIVSDNATGIDLASLLQGLIKTIFETSSSSDSLNILNRFILSDMANASDASIINIRLQINDFISGSDSVLTAIFKIISELVTANDSLSVVARIPILDSGNATESISLAVLLRLMDEISGIDGFNISRVGEGLIATVRFNINKSDANLTLKKSDTNLTLKKSDVRFTLN